MVESYDMRSNIKGKPDSQGTLFQVKDKGLLNPQQRWPRGYTPERQQAVNEVMHGANSPYLLSDKAGTGPARRDLNETIKRSTVPPEHLGGVKFQPGQASLAIHDGGRFGGGEIHGVYENERQGKDPEISILKGQESTFVPIHEIGHHVSANEATPHAEYRTGYQRGQEEAFADRYAHEHFRDRRGEQMSEMRVYPTPQHDEPTHRMNFQSAYHAGRGDIPMPQHPWGGGGKLTPQQQSFREGKEAESNRETLFRTWDNGERVNFETHPEVPKVGVPVATTKVIGWTKKGQHRG